MNDIDRSVESMDFAMRRRFAWKEITTDERMNMLDGQIDHPDKAKECMKRLNEDIETIPGLNKSYHIGPAYFLKLKHYDGDFAKLWMYHIEGILKEYLRGMPNAEISFKKLEEAYK